MWIERFTMGNDNQEWVSIVDTNSEFVALTTLPEEIRGALYEQMFEDLNLTVDNWVENNQGATSVLFVPVGKTV